MTQKRHLKKRQLKRSEWALFPKSFRDAIDPDKVTLINRPHNPFAAGKILVRGNRIYWPGFPEDFTKESTSQQALLMHELTHVWQYHTGRLSAWRYLLFPKNWVYHYYFDPDAPFDAYPTEKQADLMQDWYRVNNGCGPTRNDPEGPCPSQAELNTVVPFEWDIELIA